MPFVDMYSWLKVQGLIRNSMGRRASMEGASLAYGI